MSGIVGLAQFDGSPVEVALLRTLTDLLVFRGPDQQQMWIKDNVGFGHTLFETTDESGLDSQPLTLDQNVWIVADARIDGRQELIAKLKAGGETGLAQSSCTDAELILRAYRRWGTACLEHLLGDFAFGIWDGSRRRLFCSRDHMGVKPFYYAQIGSGVIFSNTLDCIRQHPAVSGKLNDLAIADFLLFGVNQEPATTSFAEIHRLPPAHRLVCSENGLQTSRYWRMPIDDPIFYRRPDEYIDQFHDLLRRSVGDRLRTKQVGVFMSGGLDSTTLAAAARDTLRQRNSTFELRALTQVDSFVPDEGRYAEMVATHLGIPIDCRLWTDVSDFDWEQVAFSLPEPNPEACLIPSERQSWSQLGNYSRVYLYGEGPDNALILDWRPYVAYLSSRKQFGLLARHALSTILCEKSPPFWGRISKRIKVKRYIASNLQPDYPDWLSRQLGSRLQLRERWQSLKSPSKSLHPIRPKGYASFQNPRWQTMFESFDFGVSNLFFEVRHPFADIRMLRFLLAVPPLPWCRQKYLIRKSMDGSLPGAVLRRRKATPDMSLFRQFLAKFCQAPFLPAPQIHDFIDIERFSFAATPGDAENNLRVRSLNHWLRNSPRTLHNFEERISRDRFA